MTARTAFLAAGFLAAALGLSLLPAAAQSTPAPAASPAEDNNRLDEAWDDLLETEGNLLTTSQFAELTNLAYQTAAVRVCDSLSLDKDAIGKALDKLLAEPGKTLTTAQNDERTAAILIAFGARYGLFIAEGHTDKAAFCDGAAKLKGASESLPVFVK